MSTVSKKTSPRVLPLDSTLIDHIAAGEVVERPSSVVKELVENALDAGAANVAVDLTEGGLAAIVVTDDGRGMNETDLRHSIVRHATSKLRTLKDLDAIWTYGFRGEALSSISSVSRLSITTREPGADVGLRLRIEGGQRMTLEPVGCPVGTSVAIQELFFNTPARRKFLKAAATEQAHAWDSLLRVALGRRAGGFVLTSGNRTLLDVPAQSAASERPQLAFGRRQRSLLPFDAVPGDIRVSGFLAAPKQSRRDPSCVWLFVNGRPVRDRSLQRAAVSGYQTAYGDAMGTMLIYVDVDAHSIDVNVHPQKWEVRFGDAHAVYATIERCVALAAASHASRRKAPPLPLPQGTRCAPDAPSLLSSSRQQPPRQSTSSRSSWAVAPLTTQAPSTTPDIAPKLDETRGPWSRLSPLAHAPWGTLCCLGPARTLVLVNLAAARRALARKRLDRQLAQGHAHLPSSRLLLPPSWSPRTAALAAAERFEADQHTVWGRRFGLILERCGPSRFAVCRWPTLWPEAEVVAVAEALVSGSPSSEPLNTWTEAQRMRWLSQMQDALTGLRAFAEQRAEPEASWAPRLLTALDAEAVEYSTPLAETWQPSSAAGHQAARHESVAGLGPVA